MDTLVRLLLLALLFSFPTAATAQEVQIGKGLLCDTPEQAVRFLALAGDDRDTALTKVNAEHDTAVCGIMQVAYVRGEDITTVRTAEAAYRIVEVAVVGVMTPVGMRPLPPQKQYVIFPITEIRS